MEFIFKNNVVLTLLLLAFSHLSIAQNQYHRIIWDEDPASSVVIGFSPSNDAIDAKIKYGYSVDETMWNEQQVDYTRIFKRTLTSHFVRLTGLEANSAVFFRVCDSDGCGDRFWFKTAAVTEQPFVAIAGGRYKDRS